MGKKRGKIKEGRTQLAYFQEKRKVRMTVFVFCDEDTKGKKEGGWSILFFRVTV